MRKINTLGLAILIGVVVTVLTVGVALALPSNKGIDRAKGVSSAISDNRVVGPPEFVMELSESELTKIVFIRYAPKFAKKPCDGDGVCDLDEGKWCVDCKGGDEEPESSPCYDFLAGSKPHWNWTENYYYSDQTMGDASGIAVDKWEAAVSGDIFDSGINESHPWGVYDYKNSVIIGNYEDPDVLGVTAIWFRGKNIYEYDIMLDENYFPGGAYDLETVMLHEFGHAAGLGDLYDTVCVDQVMYYQLGADKEKTELQDGDTAGIQKLYGE